MKKQVNPDSYLVKSTSLLDKLHNRSKNKLDLKKRNGLELFEKNLRNKCQSRIKLLDKQFKLTDDYGSFKSESKLNKLSKEIISNYTSEKDSTKEKISSHKSIFNVIVSPVEKLLNSNLGNDKFINRNQFITNRAKAIIRPELSGNLSFNNHNHYLPNSPSKLIKVSSDFTKFNNHLKHKKGSKSVSYQFNISSKNKLKQEPKNQTYISNFSSEKDSEYYLSTAILNKMDFKHSKTGRMEGNNQSTNKNKTSTEATIVKAK